MAKGISKETLKTWTDRKLIVDAKALHESIYVTECFGKKDMILLELALRELERRGYDVREEKRLAITKKK